MPTALLKAHQYSIYKTGLPCLTISCIPALHVEAGAEKAGSPHIVSLAEPIVDPCQGMRTRRWRSSFNLLDAENPGSWACSKNSQNSNHHINFEENASRGHKQHAITYCTHFSMYTFVFIVKGCSLSGWSSDEIVCRFTRSTVYSYPVRLISVLRILVQPSSFHIPWWRTALLYGVSHWLNLESVARLLPWITQCWSLLAMLMLEHILQTLGTSCILTSTIIVHIQNSRRV